MYDVVAMGELLIDFTPAGNSLTGNMLFERNPGGAPANVLAAISKLGGNCAFIGKVGSDQFGYFLETVLQQNRINTQGLRFSEEANTTLAFVHLDQKGDRSFSFYRKPGADTTLTVTDLDFDLIKQATIFHFGSISMTNEPSRTTTLEAVKYAKQIGKIISYDPNWRPPLWLSNAAAKEEMILGLKYADILKISAEELAFLTGEVDLTRGSQLLYDSGIKLVIVTLGPKGCYYRSGVGMGQLKTYDVEVVDTTGAGDAFLGGLLYHIGKLKVSPDQISREQLEKMLAFANAVGALCTTKKGAIPAMPTMTEVESCMGKC